MRAPIVLCTAAAIAGCAVDAAAQRTEKLDARSALISVLPETIGLAENEKDSLLGLFQAQTTTFPIGSSAGGFTWSFNPQLGIPTRRSRSFGPMFAERPLTSGRHRLGVSFGFQRTEWSSVAGQPLESGLDFAYWDRDDGWFEYRSAFTLTTEQMAVTATFGLFDNVDIGVRIPYVRQMVDGTLAFYCGFCDGTPDRVTGASEGLGDVTLRSKVSLPTRRIDLAGAVDVRLPTGDDKKLLGSGGTQVSAMLLGGGRSGAMSTHFNVGYTFAGPGLRFIEYPLDEDVYVELEYNPSDEFKYTVGAEYTISTKVTVAGDVIGRTMFNAARPFLFSDFARGSAGLRVERASVNVLLGAASAKFMIADKWLLTTAVAFPINNGGVKPGVTPVIGFERAF
jgi:hypothetical protein